MKGCEGKKGKFYGDLWCLKHHRHPIGFAGETAKVWQ
jgi:hypothetical protein